RIRPTPPSPLFPYTTLFRSGLVRHQNLMGGRLVHLPIHTGSPRRVGCSRIHLHPDDIAYLGPHEPEKVTVATSDIQHGLRQRVRSEEHTSELQSRSELVCRL